MSTINNGVQYYDNGKDIDSTADFNYSLYYERSYDRTVQSIDDIGYEATKANIDTLYPRGRAHFLECGISDASRSGCFQALQNHITPPRQTNKPARKAFDVGMYLCGRLNFCPTKVA